MTKLTPADMSKEQHNRRFMRQAIRAEVIGHYGNKCACPGCDVDRIEFMCIDHIEGGGNKERRELGLRGAAFYRHLKKLGYPPGYRVLCHNCNQSRGCYG